MNSRRNSTSEPFYGYTIVAAASLSMVLVFGIHYAFGVFFTPMSQEFGWTRAQTAGPFSLVWVVQGVLAAVMGGLNDRFGPRVVLTSCGLLIGGGYLLISQIGSIWQLYLFYGVMVGAGLGGTFVPLTSTTARWFTGRRGLMTGIVAAGVGVGALVGPLVANWLISKYQWRISYAILGSVALAGVTAAAQFLKRDPAQEGATPYGESKQAEAAEIPGFSLKQAVRSWQLWVVSIVFWCYGFALSAILLHLVPHARDLGISATRAAGLLATLGGASAIGKVLLGAMADRIGNKQIYILSFILMLVSLAWLMPAANFWTLFVFATAFGVAYGGLATAHSPLVAWLFGLKHHGLIFGVCFNGWTLGSAVGPLVAGYIFDISHSYQAAFAVCAVVSLIGLLLTSVLRPGESEFEAPAEPAGDIRAVRQSPAGGQAV